MPFGNEESPTFLLSAGSRSRFPVGNSHSPPRDPPRFGQMLRQPFSIRNPKVEEVSSDRNFGRCQVGRQGGPPPVWVRRSDVPGRRMTRGFTENT